MKKIMFNNRYGLTKAVLEGRKTMTRRIIKAPKTMDGQWVSGFAICKRPGSDEVVEVMALDADEGMINNILPKYKPGEVVAVAQSLRDMGYDPRDTKHKSGAIWGLDHTPAWTNKMFVSASECIHQIRITDVWAERLQDITEEDCLKEGVDKGYLGYYINGLKTKDWEKESHVEKDGKTYRLFPTPRKAFAALIDIIHGKGTWDSNPWVFVYEFELVK